MVIVTPFQEKKKQRNLIFVLVLVIFGAAFLIWYKFFPKRSSTPRVLPQKPEKIVINFDILKSPIMEKLVPFEGIPFFKPEDAGRNNPFSPY